MFSKKIGIDLGTANSLVYLEGQGVVLNEPTVVAVSAEDGEVLAVGNAAKEMLGRTPEGIEASRPLREGVIADYIVTEAMLRFFLDSVAGRSRLFKPEVMVCVPAGIFRSSSPSRRSSSRKISCARRPPATTSTSSSTSPRNPCSTNSSGVSAARCAADSWSASESSRRSSSGFGGSKAEHELLCRHSWFSPWSLSWPIFSEMSMVF